MKIKLALKMRIKKTHLFLFLVVLISFVLRFYKLGQVPAGFLSDEAAVGYNVYSLIKTGKDEFGQRWPLFFRSFGEGKLPVYVYEVLPPVLFFGLSAFSVRFAPAFLGSLTVLLTYFSLQELLNSLNLKNKRLKNLDSQTIALASSLGLALMPWHIHFSRGIFGQECLFWIVLASWLFYRFLSVAKKKKHKNIFLLFSFFSFLASIFTYHAARVFVPLWLVFLYALNWKKLKFKQWGLSVFLFILFIIIPSIMIARSDFGGERAVGVSIFHPQGGVSIKLNQKITELNNQPLWFIRILNNKPESYLRDFLNRYFSHFDPSFLFFKGDPLRPRYRVPDVGQLLLAQAPFLLIGIWLLFYLNLWPIIFWLILAPLPAALTFETPSSVRAIIMTFPLAVCLGLGLAWFFSFIKQQKKLIKWLFSTGLIVFSFWNIAYYLAAYYVHQEKNQPYYWQYGYQELVAKVNQYQSQYEKIKITDRRGTPYIFFLFYNQYPPEKFQAQVWDAFEPAQKFSFHAIRKLDNLEFIAQKCPAKDQTEVDVLYVCTQEDHPQEAIDKGMIKIIDEVQYQDGQSAFVFMEKVDQLNNDKGLNNGE